MPVVRRLQPVRGSGCTVSGSCAARHRLRTKFPGPPLNLRTEKAMRHLRAALIVDDAPLSRITWDLIERSKQARNYSIEFLVVQQVSKPDSRSFVARLFRYLRQYGLTSLAQKIGFLWIEKAERILALRNHKYKDLYHTYPLDEFAIVKVYVRPLVSPSGFVYRYADDDIREITSRNADVLIRCGNGILRGPILQAARF